VLKKETRLREVKSGDFRVATICEVNRRIKANIWRPAGRVQRRVVSRSGRINAAIRRWIMYYENPKFSTRDVSGSLNEQRSRLKLGTVVEINFEERRNQREKIILPSKWR
jgi:hypothetical protein